MSLAGDIDMEIDNFFDRVDAIRRRMRESDEAVRRVLNDWGTDFGDAWTNWAAEGDS